MSARVGAHQRLRRRRRCSAGWSRGWRGRAAPGSTRRSAPAPSRWVAKAWRSACGVARSGRPSRPRRRWSVACTWRGVSGPPRAARNSGRPGRVRRAGRRVGVDRLAHRGQHRRQPGLAALAEDAQGARQRRVRRLQRQGLGDPQAAAVEQGEHGLVARAVHPVRRSASAGFGDQVRAPGPRTPGAGRRA